VYKLNKIIFVIIYNMSVIFNSNDFKTNISLSESKANELYLKIQAQGTETFKNIVVNGTTDVSSLKANNLTQSRVCITDGSYNLASSTITSDELNNLTNCASNIQTQLDDKSILLDSDNAGTQRNKPIIVIGVVSASTNSSTSVSFFDANLFSVPPVVVGMCYRSGFFGVVATFSNITTSGFDCRMEVASSDSLSGQIRWVAIGY
jgi:hypothetical protein